MNEDGRFGRRGYVESDSMENAAARLDEAIEALYTDWPIIEEPVT